MMSRFDELLLGAQRSNAPKAWRDALISVSDTAFMCHAWLDEHAPGFTPADLLTMTRMVMACEETEEARIEARADT